MTTSGHDVSVTLPRVVTGDALVPVGDSPIIIVHVVNDKTPNWGGTGFARSLRSIWPEVQQDFREWVAARPQDFRLGGVRVMPLGMDMYVASIIGQHGYGPSTSPRIRYDAVREGLSAIARKAIEIGAGIHMPRIGTGNAGGEWSVLHEIITEECSERGVDVVVYVLPKKHRIRVLP